jgi:protein involved in polysaccharide export with SLBB domain
VRLAGGVTKGADEGSVFVVRANGSVISARQTAGWFQRRDSVEDTEALPGDTVFVPTEMNRSTALQTTLDWTRVLYQLGLGLAGFSTIFK